MNISHWGVWISFPLHYEKHWSSNKICAFGHMPKQSFHDHGQQFVFTFPYQRAILHTWLVWTLFFIYNSLHLKVEFTQKCKFSHNLLTLMSFLLSSVEHGDIVNNSGKHTVLVPIDFHYIFIHTMEDSGNRNCLFINNLLLLCFSFGWVGEWWHNSHFLSGLSL